MGGDDSVLDVLKQHCRLGVEAKKVRNSRGKKVTTGKQITAGDLSEAGGESSGSGVASKNGKQRKRKRRAKANEEEVWICAVCLMKVVNIT